MSDVVCIESKDCFIVGKIYNCKSVSTRSAIRGGYFLLILGEYGYDWYPSEWFLTLDEYRELKLNEVLR